MASCTGGHSAPLTEEAMVKITADLFKCIKKDQLVKAKLVMKGVRKEDKKKIVSQKLNGNPPLFIAAQQGLTHFVNYLLNDCQAEIEQQGVYEVAEDHTKHHVTPLWCAAVANKLEVVKILLHHNANVNATSDTESTPVRSACYMTNIEVVKYLVEKGADIHKPNINGGTCLINSVQSVDLCRFLIEKNANVNAQDNSGNLALHYAIREGRMETVRLLLKHGSDPYVKNDFGDDAIQTAALRGYSDILEFLVYRIKPTIERQIEAYELMATNFVDEKHDIQQAIQNWRLAMELRYKDPDNVIAKPRAPPNPAYKNHLEAATMSDLEEAALCPDAVYMQALIIRERILGPEHKDTVFGLMYRGAVYADTHRYQRCVDLWKYAFRLRHSHHCHAHCRGSMAASASPSPSTATALTAAQGEGTAASSQPLNHECLFTLQALCKLFWEIYDEYAAGFTTELVQFDDIIEVFEMSVSELQRAQQHFLEQSRAGESSQPALQQQHQQQQEEFQTIILLVLHLVNLLCLVPPSPTPPQNQSQSPSASSSLQEEDPRMFKFRQTVHRLVKLGLTTPSGRSLLHLAVDRRTSTVVEEFYSNFPSVNVVKVLLECGADANATDSAGNTALHVLVEATLRPSPAPDANAPAPQPPHQVTPPSRANIEAMIEALLAAGSHADAVNARGVSATQGLGGWWPRFRSMEYTSLKCLAARVIKKHGIPYEGEIPETLNAFLDKH